MLVRLIPGVLQNITAPARTMRPVENTPRAIAGFPATGVVCGCAPRDSAKEDPGDDGVAGRRHGAFTGTQRCEEDVGQEMGPESDRWQEDGSQVECEEGQWMVCVELEGRAWVRVAPSHMALRECSALGCVVEEEAVYVVRQDLARREQDEYMLEQLPRQRQRRRRAEQRLACCVDEAVA